MKILNIHGYRGSAENAAFAALKANDHDVVSPQLDYDILSPEEMLQKLSSTAHSEGAEMLVGTSLGGFFAAVISAETKLPVVLVNPCLMAFYHLPLLGWQGDVTQFIRLFGKTAELDADKTSCIIGGSDEVVTTHSFTRSLLGDKVRVIPDGMHSGATLPLKEFFAEVIG